MNDRMAVEASPQAEPVAIPMTFDEVVNRFCHQQVEFRETLARAGMDGTEPMGFTGGHSDVQT